MISQKAKYALKALVALADARAGDEGALRIEEIARRSGTPKRFLEHILLDIRNAGLISSRRGRVGGYQLIKPPETISIGAILRMVDGPIAPLPCLSRGAYQRCDDCSSEEECRIRWVMADVFSAYLLVIESVTLADFMRRESVDPSGAALALLQ